ncbi:hypothetical protein ZIOFF_053428 [Zingiber officinale]|uniref:Uncharacterized protein n=1 Tax=Zingiber officinale TaxID=94328 RepID=A0A8J5FGA9_ZINOF|nr:hypothetical protein ZIOFF_053428 [Zingiber officinale]
MGLIEKLYLNLLSYSSPGWAAAIGGALVVITLFLSMFLLFQHLSSYKNPEEQKFLVGVILMVPCYSVESYVSLVNPSISADCEILRDCYEAFAMYCFGRYLVACMGGEDRTIEFLNRQGGVTSKTTLLENVSEKGIIKHPFPMNYFLEPWRLSEWFYQSIKIGIVQYLWFLKLSEYIVKESSSGSVGDVLSMFIASIVHLYVFPAEPYKLMGERITSGVAVLGDYASLDCPLDPDEVRDSERPIKLRLPQPDLATKSSTAIRESVRDVFVGGGEYIVNDLKFTVTHAVEPMEKGFTRFNRKLHRFSENIRKHEKGKLKTKDDSSMGSSSLVKRVRGIDDPLLNGSVSDSAAKRGRRQVKESGNKSAESGGENSDTGHGGFEVHGCRWITKD